MTTSIQALEHAKTQLQIDCPLETLLFHTTKMHRKLASRVLDEHGFHRGQPPLILALSHQDGRTLSELAEIMEVTPATISNMVKRMEKGGFLIRKQDTHDERVKRVWLTDIGRGKVTDLQATVKEMEQFTFANFTDEEQAQMSHLLQKVIHNLANALGECC